MKRHAVLNAFMSLLVMPVAAFSFLVLLTSRTVFAQNAPFSPEYEGLFLAPSSDIPIGNIDLDASTSPYDIPLNIDDDSPVGSLALPSSPSSRMTLLDADLLLDQGVDQYRADQLQAALQSWNRALELYQSPEIQREIPQDSLLGIAWASGNLGFAYWSLEQYEQAIEAFERSLALLQDVGEPWEEDNVLGSLGLLYAELGQYERAVAFHEQRLAIARERDDAIGEEKALVNLGNAYWGLGQYEQAIEFYEQSLIVVRGSNEPLEEGDTLTNLGDAYADLARYEQAIDAYEQSLAIFRDVNNSLGESIALNQLGLVYSDLSQYPQAIEFHEQSLDIAREIGDRRGERIALNNLGLAYSDLSQYPQAIEFYEPALVIAREMGDRRGEGVALGNLGDAYNSLGQYEQAIKFQEQYLAIAREINDRQGEGLALGSLGNVYNDLGQYPQAIEFHEQYLVIAREIGDRRGEGYALNNLGNAHSGLGRYPQAIEFYEQSLAATRETENLAGEGLALGNLGAAYRSLGYYQQAVEFAEQSLDIAREIGDRAREGNALNNLGKAYLRLGQYVQAINFYDQHLVIAREIGDYAGEGNALGSLGEVYDALGQYEQAIDFYEQYLAIAREIGDRDAEGIALGSLGETYFILGQDEEALDFLEQSLAVARVIGNRAEEGNSLGGLSNVYIILGQHEEAIDLYEQSIAIAREIGNRRGEGIALGNLGVAYNRLGLPERALEQYQQALNIAQEISDRAGEGNVLNNLGIAHLSLERYPQATETLFAAIEVYESLRDGDIPDAQQITFFDTQSSAYGFLQRSLIAQGETEQALAISERGRVRAFVSSLAERQNQDAPALPPPSIADIQRTAQAQNATLVQYSRASFGDGVSQLYIWVIQPTGEITFRSVDLSGLDSSLFDVITTGRDAIGLRSRNNDATIEVALTPEALRAQTERQRQILQDLHTLLIDPIADLLPTDPDAPVIIIPHQELFLVPFAALVDANGDYLIQHHTLLTAPSIQVLQLLGEQQTTTAAGDPLIIGNPIMPSIWNPATGEEEILSSLPGAEAEAIAIAEVFNTEPLLWEQASEAAVTRRMATASILHFATHGLLDYGDPTATGVRDFPGAIALAADNGNDGLLTSAEIFDLSLSAELVVLSACDTGRGRITGDGVIGLSRAFIQAGVPQVLVSLWAVPDAPTAELMTTFYAQRDLTDTDAQALRQAMLITLENHPNPRDWAAFTLIGGAQ